jgi:hypothetical protein
MIYNPPLSFPKRKWYDIFCYFCDSLRLRLATLACTSFYKYSYQNTRLGMCYESYDGIHIRSSITRQSGAWPSKIVGGITEEMLEASSSTSWSTVIIHRRSDDICRRMVSFLFSKKAKLSNAYCNCNCMQSYLAQWINILFQNESVTVFPVPVAA